MVDTQETSIKYHIILDDTTKKYSTNKLVKMQNFILECWRFFKILK